MQIFFFICTGGRCFYSQPVPAVPWFLLEVSVLCWMAAEFLCFQTAFFRNEEDPAHLSRVALRILTGFAFSVDLQDGDFWQGGSNKHSYLSYNSCCRLSSHPSSISPDLFRIKLGLVEPTSKGGCCLHFLTVWCRLERICTLPWPDKVVGL